MRLVVSTTLEGEPWPKERPRFTRKTGKVYTPATTTNEESALKHELKRWLDYLEPDKTSVFLVEAQFHCESDKTDLDNLIKLVLDACNKLVWLDDRQVGRIDASVLRKAELPRTVLKIYAF